MECNNFKILKLEIENTLKNVIGIQVFEIFAVYGDMAVRVPL